MSLVHRVVDEMKCKYPVIGAFVTGSFARGEIDKNSDIDLFILIEDSWRQKMVRYMDGHELEICINPSWQLARELDDALKHGDPCTAFILSDAKILLDPFGKVAQLKERAQIVINSKPPTGNHMHQELTRYGVTDLVKDVEDVYLTGNAMLYQVILGNAIDYIVRVYFETHRFWTPKLKHRFREFLRLEPSAEILLQESLNGNVSALFQLAELALKPIGGLVKGDWELPVEELKK